MKGDAKDGGYTAGITTVGDANGIGQPSASLNTGMMDKAKEQQDSAASAILDGGAVDDEPKEQDNALSPTDVDDGLAEALAHADAVAAAVQARRHARTESRKATLQDDAMIDAVDSGAVAAVASGRIICMRCSQLR